MNAQIGIEEKGRRKIVEVLSRTLGSEAVLLAKTKNYHWNVAGANFSELHQLFDKQYEQISGAVDEVAERIRSLGSKTPATLAEFLKLSIVKEKQGDYPRDRKMIENLLIDHEGVIREMRSAVELTSKLGDAGTSDFLTGLMEEHEKTAWMLRSYLEN